MKFSVLQAIGAAWGGIKVSMIPFITKGEI